jgi:hypothetical protein
LLSDALSFNSSLEFLDLFDVDFSNEGASLLEAALKKNESLMSLRLANTNVTTEASEPLLKTMIGSRTLKAVRWVNLLPFGGTIHVENSLSKLIQIEYRPKPVTRGIYYNTYCGDLVYGLLADIYRC